GRGGGHGPLEKPYGVSLTLLETGKPLWSRELKAACYYQSHWNAKELYWFEQTNQLILDPLTGATLRRQNLSDDVTYDDPLEGTRQENTSLKVGKEVPFTKQTNIVAGDYHYYLAHNITAIGRVHIPTGNTEYLRVPAQLVASDQGRDHHQLLWDKKDALPNDTKNSRGIDIATDKRAKGTGWGHVSAASPILVNQHLFFPIMNGTVYVIDAFAESLDESALIAINDLGPAGQTWTLAGFTYANGRLWTRTMKEVICLE
ncbi:MAG: hypothetical protein AAGJ31_12190, partial [Verrucomicrobiota bacterium]